jgi:hypothetical protein
MPGLLLPKAKRFDLNRDIQGLWMWHDYADVSSMDLQDNAGIRSIKKIRNKVTNDQYNIFGWIENFEPWQFVHSYDPQSGNSYAQHRSGGGNWRYPNWTDPGTSQSSLVIVTRKTSLTSNAWSTGIWESSGTYLPYSDGNFYSGWGSNSRQLSSVAPPDGYSDWHIFSARSKTNLWIANQNGKVLVRGTSNTYAGSTAQTALDTSDYYDNAEHVIVNHFLEAGELNYIGRYLGEKWGVKWNDVSE